MTRSNKTPKNPTKSRIKSLKSVTHQKHTWRKWHKWHNQPGLLPRQAADERRHDRLFGRFDVIHNVTTTRSRFCVTFFVPTSVAVNPFHQPVTTYLFHQPILNLSPPTCYRTRYFIRSALQSIPSISIATSTSAGDRYYLLCLWFCLSYRPVIV